MSSPPVDSVMMEVTPTHATPVRSETPFVGPQCQPWVELSRHPCRVMGTPKPSEPTGAKRWSYVNLLVVVVKVCSALLALSSGLYFYFNGCSLWKRRNESAGVTPEMPESVQFQVSVGVSGPQIPVHFLRPTPHISMETQTFPMGTPNDPQPHMAYPHIYEHHPYPALGKHKPALRGTPAHRYP